jgi:alanyl-tRNA synthetase
MSFHLGKEAATIDLAREVSPAEIAAAEREANRVVWEDRKVAVRFATSEEASRLPLRKESTREGALRLVEVADFDLSACGGTHVPATGMVGVIAVAAWERFKGGSRISFVCGARALRSHAGLRDIVAGAARQLSVGPADLPIAIERLQTDLKAAAKMSQHLHEELSQHRATVLRGKAEAIHGLNVVLSVEPGMDSGALKRLAGEIVQEPGLVALLVGDGQPAPVVMARSADVGLDAGSWLKHAVASLGGRGGGRPEQAQGGIPAAPEQILAFARESVGASTRPV